MKKLKILVSCYACGPNWGSEIGMGWNWTQSLGKKVDLTVITEKTFEKEIEETYRDKKRNKNLAPIIFQYVDIGPSARERGWNQGDWSFYFDYRSWQWKVYQLARILHQKEKYDLVHQLNMTGYREPGFLWKLTAPFVWGPIGGHMQMPLAYLSILGVKDSLKNIIRNIVNYLQMRFQPRVLKAMEKASLLIACTPEDENAIGRIHGKRAELIIETGKVNIKPYHHVFNTRRSLEVLWSGKFFPRKALPLALRAIKEASLYCPLKLTVIGSGPCEARWKREANELGISEKITWLGKVPHEIALKVTRNSDLLLFTSLMEGTPHVVLEALSFGLPVICHDAFGFGVAVNETCGLKVPLQSPELSSKGFAEALIKLKTQKGLITRLSNGAFKRAQELSYDKKAQQVVDLYQKVLSK